ncbi:RNA-binding protein [Francisella persica ATCC VR-331]|uniref:RNA-binding protein n=1 Tax=Francisella persica ATCC VR-331 TaxID=1086726 RepID=A0AAC9EUA0_9GAMM|nr:ribosome assembly RNA-binding protein YhbY [Francisella persica]ALB01487.1 RNA-binding protein [Francisella persica ATCC VR-331]ANH77778.1 RNA-binding protein [Francisella persica ATCC VR-331]
MDVKQQKKLKAQVHSLKPVVLIGEKGLTENVILEIDLALASHQLIKVKAGRLPKEEKQQIASEITQTTKSELVQIIGNIIVLYRRNPNKGKR